jgi:hypothetical protein
MLFYSNTGGFWPRYAPMLCVYGTRLLTHENGKRGRLAVLRIRIRRSIITKILWMRNTGAGAPSLAPPARFNDEKRKSTENPSLGQNPRIKKAVSYQDRHGHVQFVG